MTSSLQENYKFSTQIVFCWHSEQFMYTTCSEHVIFKYWTGDSMNNLLSNFGLVDAKIRASDKGLPVHNFVHVKIYINEPNNS